jgi:hypothetical protein
VSAEVNRPGTSVADEVAARHHIETQRDRLRAVVDALRRAERAGSRRDRWDEATRLTLWADMRQRLDRFEGRDPFEPYTEVELTMVDEFLADETLRKAGTVNDDGSLMGHQEPKGDASSPAEAGWAIDEDGDPGIEALMGLYPSVRALVAERSRLEDAMKAARPVLEYVSRGRRGVGIGRYPDAEARRALGLADEGEELAP